jgi:hypothetical protein
MKPIIWLGIVLVVAGGLIFAYQGINYTRDRSVLDVESVHVTTETHQRIPLPPVLGGLAVVGGVVLLGVGTISKS